MNISTVPDRPDLLDIITSCPRCDVEKIVQVRKEDYYNWRNKGMLIQQALSYLSDSERERLITGYCDRCWNELFDDLEEEGA